MPLVRVVDLVEGLLENIVDVQADVRVDSRADVGTPVTWVYPNYAVNARLPNPGKPYLGAHSEQRDTAPDIPGIRRA